jgi:hypothetical protein
MGEKEEEVKINFDIVQKWIINQITRHKIA